MRNTHSWLATGAAIFALACGTDPTPAPVVKTCAEKAGFACVYIGTGVAGFNGDGKPLRESRLYSPLDLDFAPDGTPWIVDFNNHRLRTVTAAGTLKTQVGTILPGDGDENLADLTPAGAPGDEVSLNHPTDFAFGPDGTVYFVSWHNFKIRTVDATSDIVHVIAGGKSILGGFSGDGGAPRDANFNFPKSIVRNSAGDLFILDQRNFRVRKISAGATPIVSTIAGDGTAGFKGDDGDPMAAEFKFEAGNAPMPSGALALSADGKTIYVADSLNHRIRKIDLDGHKITTIAGTGEPGFAGDGGPAISAKLSNPRDLELGPDGKLYVADTDNHAVRAIDFVSGNITTVVGDGTVGNSDEGLDAKLTKLHKPWGIAFDAKGALYVADTENHRILKVPK